MGKPEVLELGLIVLAATGTWFAQSMFPDVLPLGRVLLMASGLLLLQSLIRDLSILARKSNEGKAPQPEAARCMCIESAVGAAGVVIGAVLVGAGVGASVAMPGLAWVVLVLLVLLAGLLIKDFVFEWAPWRIRRDKDHMNIIFTLKK